MLIHCVVLFVLSIPVEVFSTLTVTWNGMQINDPILIYHDEVAVSRFPPPLHTLDDPGSGILLCRGQSGRASWFYTSSIFVNILNPVFYQTRTNPGVIPSQSGLLRSVDGIVSTADHNGLWTCRMNGDIIGSIAVGLYQRGLGGILSNQVTFASLPSFDSPTFTLVGETRGGPPTTYTWKRNFEVLTHGGSFSISTYSPANNIYVSTLTVTGRIRGTYFYLVSNRAMGNTLTSSVHFPPVYVALMGPTSDIGARPRLLYTSELGSPDDLSTSTGLTCRSYTGLSAAWHLTDGTVIGKDNSIYTVSTTDPGVIPSISKLLLRSPPSKQHPDHTSYGLLTCRAGDNEEDSVPVGLYQEGNGQITTNEVSLSSSSFLTDPPTFTLIAKTTGGPPEVSTWIKDNLVISSDISVSLAVDQSSPTRFRDSAYVSTLTATGRQPGQYVYIVSNIASRDSLASRFITIEDGVNVTDVRSVQTTLPNTIEVSWTALPSSPSGGFLVTVIPANIQETVPGSSRSLTLTISQTGIINTIQVQPLTPHYPSVSASVEVIVKGSLPPAVSISLMSDTEVSILWGQTTFSQSVSLYIVSLARVTGSGQALCPNVSDEKPAIRTTNFLVSFSNLEEYSAYKATVTAIFSITKGNFSNEANFTTASAAPGAAPTIASSLTTSTNVTITWDAIECIERNGEIVDYVVEFQDQGGDNLNGSVDFMSREFMSDVLTPNSEYSFRVAGTNIDGQGPFSNRMVIFTDESAPGPVSALIIHRRSDAIVLIWSAPQEPNGVITRYEVTYRVSGGRPITINTNLNTTFTISSLATQTTVSDISISAYTRIGRGEAYIIPSLMTTQRVAIMINIEVEVLSSSSVRVSWEVESDLLVASSELEIYTITGFIVYYSQIGNGSEKSVVTLNNDSVVIEDLIGKKEYQFQLAIIAELDNDIIITERSMPSTVVIEIAATIATTASSSIAASPQFIGGFIAFVVLSVCVVLVLVVFYAAKRHNSRASTHYHSKSNKDSKAARSKDVVEEKERKRMATIISQSKKPWSGTRDEMIDGGASTSTKGNAAKRSKSKTTQGGTRDTDSISSLSEESQTGDESYSDSEWTEEDSSGTSTTGTSTCSEEDTTTTSSVSSGESTRSSAT